MAVKMRLMRMGKKRSPSYRVVVVDGRAPRDSKYIDLIGTYDPTVEPSRIEIDSEKAVDWLRKGVQPTDPVRKLLEITGTMALFKVASGRVHTVGAPDTPASPDAPADPPGGDAAAAVDAAVGAAEEE